MDLLRQLKHSLNLAGLFITHDLKVAARIWDRRVVEPGRVCRLADLAANGAPRNTRSPDFLALNPQGAVPVMEDADLVLSEGLAINLYLARAYGGDLGPRNAVEDALMQQWALDGATVVEPSALLPMHACAEG